MVSISNKLINHNIIIVSKWHSSLGNLDFDSTKYQHVVPTLSDKIYKMILKVVPYKIKNFFGYTSIDRIIYYRGINVILKKLNLT